MSGEANTYNIFGLLIDKEIALLFLGAIIGFGASLVTNWINNRAQRKKEEKEKAISTIADAVKFVSKINELADDYRIMKEHYDGLIFKARSPIDAEKIKEKKSAYLLRVFDRLSDIYEQDTFIDFQIETLGNQDILKKYRALRDIYIEFNQAISKQKKLEESKFIQKKEEAHKLYHDFINHCVEICKANAPNRTLYAPAKKKGPRRKR